MANYPLFSVIGIEIEYMLVDKDSLQIKPCSDILLRELANERHLAEINEIPLGKISISNELVLHLIELKNSFPTPPNENLSLYFQSTINQLLPILDKYNITLLPTSLHPWMDPTKETKCWPHSNKEIYQQYHKIFNCYTHGFANVQSLQINLPFNNDTEFNQLHNLIRLLLPLLPAIAASSPFYENKYSSYQDTRLLFYGKNQQKLSKISGNLIPEFISSREEYQRLILLPMYEEITPFDPQAILQYEWLNSRLAIPKFEMDAIEIRVLDSQECVQADITIALAIMLILKKMLLANDYYLFNPYPTKNLQNIYQQILKNGLHVKIDSKEFLQQLQLPQQPLTCEQIWAKLIDRICSDLSYQEQQILENILRNGNLAERMIKFCVKDNYSYKSLKKCYYKLNECLIYNTIF